MDPTSSIVWLTIALIFVIAVATTKTRTERAVNHPVRNNPLPPVVHGASVLGLLHTLITKGLRAMIHEQCTRLGSVFTVSLFWWKITFLVGPEVSDHFFRGSDSEISQGDLLKFLGPIFGNDVLYGVDETTRIEQLRFAKEAIKPSRLKNQADNMVQEVEEYFSKWGDHGVVDLKLELGQLLMMIASRCLLGREVRENMFTDIYTLFHELNDNGFNLTCIFFPYAPTPWSRLRDKARSKIYEIFKEIVRSRRRSNRAGVDVLQSLIDSKHKDGRPTSEEEVVGLIISLIFGGLHTSLSASTWTGAYLLSHARYLTAVIEEQNRIVQTHGEQIDYNTLKEMASLHRSIQEALRLHPPAQVLFRKVHKNFTVHTKEGYNYDIPRGHTVVSPVLYNINLPDIYKDPGVYDPDRFGPGREEDRLGGRLSYTVFSSGRHACAGEAYAYMQIKVIWSHLLRNFELKLESPFPVSDWRKIVAEPKGKVMVSYKRLPAF